MTAFIRGLCVAISCHAAATPASERAAYDVVVYGGTAGGVAAAVQAARMGKSVVLIEPSGHLGGLTSGGLGATDIGNKAAIGGIAREFYQRVKRHYDDPAAWRQQKRQEYKEGRQRAGEDTMWTFEPHVAEKILNEMIREAKVAVLLRDRLDQKLPVRREGTRIVEIALASGRRIGGRRFIDCTYEGDLMAKAGVSYTIGREANATYGETLNGVQTRQAVHHQLLVGIDPFVRRGDKSSGLLPGIDPAGPGQEGAADRRVQAYNFRMCLTDAADNRILFAKPDGYDERDYELLFRNFEAGERRVPWSFAAMPNRKTDINNNYGFSTDYIGASYEWPNGDYATRERIFRSHLTYQQGLMWTLANHPRVPEHIRREVGRFGLCRDEFRDTSGWPHQLYVREARRMVSDYVMTQHNCQGSRTVDDAVSRAAYTMDSHHVQRYIDSRGHVRNEGDVQVGGFSPYPIAYRSIVPRTGQCENLLVPVCLSASHIAYGSIRMEPVFMVLGQSAATAACLSLDAGVPVQQVDIKTLQARLVADGQVLKWSGPPVKGSGGIDPATLAGIVVDDTAAELTGEWTKSTAVPGYVGAHYLHDDNADKGRCQATFVIPVKDSGRYEVRVSYTPHPNRASNVPITVSHTDGKTTLRIDQRKQTSADRGFVSIGRFSFDAARRATVTISTSDANGYVVVDAVQVLRHESVRPTKK